MNLITKLEKALIISETNSIHLWNEKGKYFKSIAFRNKPKKRYKAFHWDGDKYKVSFEKDGELYKWNGEKWIKIEQFRRYVYFTLDKKYLKKKEVSMFKFLKGFIKVAGIILKYATVIIPIIQNAMRDVKKAKDKKAGI